MTGAGLVLILTTRRLVSCPGLQSPLLRNFLVPTVEVHEGQGSTRPVSGLVGPRNFLFWVHVGEGSEGLYTVFDEVFSEGEVHSTSVLVPRRTSSVLVPTCLPPGRGGGRRSGPLTRHL